MAGGRTEGSARMSEGSDGGHDSRWTREAAETSDGGDAYQLYRRGLSQVESGSAAGAAPGLQRGGGGGAPAAEPQSRSVLEAPTRSQFDAGWYADAAANFRRIVEASPTDDYAQFGLGLALARTGDHLAAAEHLALAAAMRPNLRNYTEALRSVRATLNARNRLREESSD